VAEAREERREGRQLFCRIITPEEMVYDGQANLVIARIADGEIGVLVDHAPLVSTVEIGDVRIREGEDWRVYATSDGFFKVAENLVQILVEEAEAAEAIDVEAAENRIEEAERAASEISGEDEDAERKRRDLERRQRIADNLVRVARRYAEG
jgi:F-type H+-transporting ATPase subunit epsilon